MLANVESYEIVREVKSKKTSLTCTREGCNGELVSYGYDGEMGGYEHHCTECDQIEYLPDIYPKMEQLFLDYDTEDVLKGLIKSLYNMDSNLFDPADRQFIEDKKVFFFGS